MIQRQTPPVLIRQMSKLWASAGRPENWPVERLLATKYLLGLVGIVIAIAAVALNPSTLGAMIGVGVALLPCSSCPSFGCTAARSSAAKASPCNFPTSSTR